MEHSIHLHFIKNFKMAILTKAICMFNAIPIKISMTFITKIEKFTLKFIWKHKRPQIAKAILSKKSNTGGITIPEFKQYYRTKQSKRIVLAQNRYKDQWNRIEGTDMNSHSYAHQIFDKGAKNIRMMEKRQTLQQMVLGSKWTELENILFNEVSQGKKAKNHIFSLICRL
jgi:hypothetical protein